VPAQAELAHEHAEAAAEEEGEAEGVVSDAQHVGLEAPLGEDVDVGQRGER
jgi:hypothetical protein